MEVMAIGDVHGKTKHMLTPLRDQEPDVCFQVGDFEPIRNEKDLEEIATPQKYRSMGQFPDLYDSDFEFPVPTFFIAGNHEPWGFLDQHDPLYNSTAQRNILSNLTYLGRHSVTEVNGLTVAALSGNYGESSYEKHSDERQEWCQRHNYQARKASSHFRYDEVIALQESCEGRDVDVLLTHEWPSGLVTEDEAEVMAREAPDHITKSRILNYGVKPVRELLEALEPSYHFCGHIHHRLERNVGPTNVVCLGHINDGEDAWTLRTVSSEDGS